jgi:hypothetical protein
MHTRYAVEGGGAVLTKDGFRNTQSSSINTSPSKFDINCDELNKNQDVITIEDAQKSKVMETSLHIKDKPISKTRSHQVLISVKKNV